MSHIHGIKISVPHLNYADNNCLQSINDNFLYYACAVDPTMLPSINEISTFQSALPQYKLEKSNQVLDYASAHLNTTIWYHTSDMILMPYTDDAYLVMTASRSSISYHYYFTNRIPDYSRVNLNPNEPILTELKTLKPMVSSSTEAETVGTFKIAQNVIPLSHILETVFLYQQPTKASPITIARVTSQNILTCFIKTRK